MKFRIAEIFGPTIQGEGRNVGIPCHFVRFGGCDFRCSWCDTPHAVLPELVSKLPQMTEHAIYDKVHSLGMDENGLQPINDVEWVVLTGGNPALFSLSDLIDMFHKGRYKIMVETQGSTFREWFGKVDDLCFSPKPPSAGNTTDLPTLQKIITKTISAQVDWSKATDNWQFQLPYLKVPIFSDEDLDYAEEVVANFEPDTEIFLSVGNTDPWLPTVGNPNPRPRPHEHRPTRDIILRNFGVTLDEVLKSRPNLQGCRIFPQQHVLLWGNERGH